PALVESFGSNTATALGAACAAGGAVAGFGLVTAGQALEKKYEELPRGQQEEIYNITKGASEGLGAIGLIQFGRTVYNSSAIAAVQDPLVQVSLASGFALSGVASQQESIIRR